MLDEPVVNFTQSVVDDSIKKNAGCQYQSGLSPKIRRISMGKCCKWCGRLVGTYDYATVRNTGNDVFRRHKHCRCTVEFITNGKRQNVHTKKWKKDKIKVENLDNKLYNDIELSENEKRAINTYISSESYIINDKLRNNIPMDKDEIEICKHLDSALKKCPVYTGTLQRSLSFSNSQAMDAFLEPYIGYGSIKYKEYISTTKGKTYNPEGQVQIFIQNTKKGRDISLYNSGEQEVLYERESEFTIINMVEKNDKVYILLEELNE